MAVLSTLGGGALLMMLAPLALADDTYYVQNTGAALDRLVASDWFNPTGNGLWEIPGGSGPYWWQSANMLTTSLNTMSLISDQYQQHSGIVATVYNTNYHPNYRRSMPGKKNGKREPENFTDGFTDDSAWWGLAWIRARDVMGNIEYLNSAIDVWNYINGHYSPDCPNLVLWNINQSGVTSISNSLFMTLSAAITNRVGDNDKAGFLQAAENTWAALEASGVINQSNWAVNDGVTVPGCVNNGNPQYTYNTGSMIEALVELYRANGNSTLLDIAENMANAAVEPNGTWTNGNDVLTEGCVENNSCGGDGDQFKGVLLRGLMEFYIERPSSNIQSFVLANAQSIWANDYQQQDSGSTLGVDWRGPFTDGTPSTQSSALDALNAAVYVSGTNDGQPHRMRRSLEV